MLARAKQGFALSMCESLKLFVRCGTGVVAISSGYVVMGNGVHEKSQYSSDGSLWW